MSSIEMIALNQRVRIANKERDELASLVKRLKADLAIAQESGFDVNQDYKALTAPQIDCAYDGFTAGYNAGRASRSKTTNVVTQRRHYINQLTKGQKVCHINQQAKGK